MRILLMGLGTVEKFGHVDHTFASVRKLPLFGTIDSVRVTSVYWDTDISETVTIEETFTLDEAEAYAAKLTNAVALFRRDNQDSSERQEPCQVESTQYVKVLGKSKRYRRT